MITRRKFLAASAAAPLVFSRSSAVQANDRITLGFIGVGTRAAGISAACSAARRSRSSPSATWSRSGSTTPSRRSRRSTPTGSSPATTRAWRPTATSASCSITRVSTRS